MSLWAGYPSTLERKLRDLGLGPGSATHCVTEQISSSRRAVLQEGPRPVIQTLYLH